MVMVFFVIDIFMSKREEEKKEIPKRKTVKQHFYVFYTYFKIVDYGFWNKLIIS